MSVSRLVFALGVCVLAACGGARPERSLSVTAPSGRVVPVESLTLAYEVDGLKVIQRPNTANDVVAVNLYLLGGTRQVTAATAGIEPLLLGVSEYGTRRYPGAQTRRARLRTGSQIVVEPEVDWTLFGFRGIKQEFDSTWAVFAERVMHPALDSAAVELVRGQLIGDARLRRNAPDALVRRIADSIAFADHPYAIDPAGSERSLGAISAADMRRYAAEQMVTSRMLLVVVGDVPREKIEGSVRSTLGKLAPGDYRWRLPPELPIRSTSVAVAHRQLATNYLLGYFNGPLASSNDYPAFRVATALLSSQMHIAIREQRGLSYAAYATFLEQAVPASGMYVTTATPNDVIPLLREEVSRLQTESLRPRSVREFVEQFITDYFAENETNAAQADFLARAQLYHADYRAATRFMDALRRVTGADLQRVSRQYFRNPQFAYLGDSTRVSVESLRRF